MGAVRRRALLIGAGTMMAAAAGAWRMREQPVTVPDAPMGDERVERRYSAARGREVDFYTAREEPRNGNRR